jgi:hypothetical protein
MVEPKRLLEELGPGLERELLIRGSGERPPAGARDRVSAALFGGTLALPPAPHAELAPAAAGSTLNGVTASGGFAIAKWLAIGALLGGVSSAAGVAAEPPRVQALRHAAHVLTPAVERAERPLPAPLVTTLPAVDVKRPRSAKPIGTVKIGETSMTLHSKPRADR